VQGKLPEALKHTEQAIALDAKLTEAFFQAAKISMAAGKPGEALLVLRKAIDQSFDYIVKAAADGDFKRYEDELNKFYLQLQNEQFEQLEPKAKMALFEAEEWAKTISEVAGQNKILASWKNLLNGSWGLLELMQYAKAGFDKDRQIIRDSYNKGLERLKSESGARKIAERRELVRKRNTWRVETQSVKLERYVDEQYKVEEKYEEEVVIKAGGWFSKPQTEMVSKTRLVTKTRRVRREVEESKKILVNGIDEIIDYFKFVRIPAGNFMMGTSDKHKVTISKPFEMMAYPVTQALWQDVMGSNPSHFHGLGLPVEQVNWQDVQDFIKKLNKREGVGYYRLPTEAEWEYTCRAGTTGDQYGELREIAWYSDNSKYKTHPVGQKNPNAWGLYDMIGNVWEWCSESSGLYASEVKADQKDAIRGSYRILRGGSFENDGLVCHSANRYFYDPYFRANYNGFRCVHD
jgi:tetratricopeptide (TPR) repeat protein